MKSLLLAFSFVSNVKDVLTTQSNTSMDISLMPSPTNGPIRASASTSTIAVVSISSASLAPTPSALIGRNSNKSLVTNHGGMNHGSNTTTRMDPKFLALMLKISEILRHESHFRIADMCAAILSFVLLSVLKLPKTTKFFVHKNLVLAFGITDFFVGVLANENIRAKIVTDTAGCIVTFILNYYWQLVLHAWMTVEAFNIWLKLSAVFDTRSKFKTHMGYLFFGYGCPGIITTIVVLAFYDEVSNNYMCFSFKSEDIWIYRGPIVVYLLLITLAFVYILGLTIKHISSSQKYSGGFTKLLASVRTFLVLYPILGISQMLFLFWEKAPIVLAWTSVLLNSFLAVLFFLLHIAFDAQVQETVLKLFGKTKNNSTQSRNTKTVMQGTSSSMSTVATICNNRSSLPTEQGPKGLASDQNTAI